MNLRQAKTIRLIMQLFETYPVWLFTEEEVAVATGIKRVTVRGCLLLLKEEAIAYHKGQYRFKGYKREAS